MLTAQYVLQLDLWLLHFHLDFSVRHLYSFHTNLPFAVDRYSCEIDLHAVAAFGLDTVDSIPLASSAVVVAAAVVADAASLVCLDYLWPEVALVHVEYLKIALVVMVSVSVQLIVLRVRTEVHLHCRANHDVFVADLNFAMNLNGLHVMFLAMQCHLLLIFRLLLIASIHPFCYY